MAVTQAKKREVDGQVMADSARVAELDQVSVHFSDADGVHVTALSNVSMSVRASELLVVVGRSGCGKTTVLNLLTGLIAPSAGRVEVLGRSPAKARDHMAYMFARDALLPWRTAQGNVEYGLEIRGNGKNRQERRAIAAEMLEQVGLARAGRRYPTQLSQGMRQRVALARTWVLDPALLLMDEPFAALDAQTRAEVQAEFVRQWELRRNAVVFVTHDLNEAVLLADRILVMRDGAIIRELEVNAPRPREKDKKDVALEPWYQELLRELRELISWTDSEGHEG